MKINTVILIISAMIMFIYAFGGLGFMIMTKTPYQPSLGATIIMFAAVIAGTAGWFRTATT